jgi:hypothetical protein
MTSIDINWGHNCEHGVDSPEYTVLQDTHHGNTTITSHTDACCADMLFASCFILVDSSVKCEHDPSHYGGSVMDSRLNELTIGVQVEHDASVLPSEEMIAPR